MNRLRFRLRLSKTKRLGLRLSRQKWIQVLIFLCTVASPAWGASIPYTFQTADIVGPTGAVAFPEDIDDDGTLIGNLRLSGLVHGIIDPGNSRRPEVVFTCAHDTHVTSISRGKVAGDCDGALGLLRSRGGEIMLLDFPGTDETVARGLSGDNVVGQIVLPLRFDHGGALSYRFKGFRWNRLTNQYNEIDLLIDNTFVDLLAINNQGKILGRYLIVDLGNNTLESGFFVDDNGAFDFPFPLDFSGTGGDSTFVTDMNDSDQALLIRRIAGQVKLQLFDDGVFLDITGFPSDWIPINVRGMNNKAQFTGSYCVNGCRSVADFHGFVASPQPANVARGRNK